jgi:epsilon-lactone hydrolase
LRLAGDHVSSSGWWFVGIARPDDFGSSVVGARACHDVDDGGSRERREMPIEHRCCDASAWLPPGRAAIISAVADEPARVLAFPAAADAVELRHLRAFVAVAEELNFGRAAERLFITQPALSRQIRALEQLVRCELLRRSTRRVELTLAGEALLDRARRLLRDVDEAVEAVQAVGGEILARIAGLWQPIGERVADDADLDEQRAAYEALLAHFDVPAGVHVRPVNAGGVPALHVAQDSAEAPGILYLHGGGFVLGSAFGYRPLASALALAAGRAVLVADYRLAPEHPFPAALDDAHAAYRWMLERHGDPAKLIVAGDSVGGGLALALLLRLRDEGLPLPAGAALLCPAADIKASTVDWDPDDPTRRQMLEKLWRGCKEVYLAGHPADDPLVSPLLGDLSGLPPLLIQAGAEDLWVGEAQALEDRAQKQSVQVQLQLYPTDAHVFHLFWPFLPEAADALEAAGQFIRARTAASRHAAGAG